MANFLTQTVKSVQEVSLSEVAQQAAVAAAGAGKLSVLEFLLDMAEVKVGKEYLKVRAIGTITHFWHSQCFLFYSC